MMREPAHPGFLGLGVAIAGVALVTRLMIASGHAPTLPPDLTAMSPIGIILRFGVMVTALYRSWWLAADHQIGFDGAPLSSTAATLVPWLLVVIATAFVVAGTSFGLTSAFVASWPVLVPVTVKFKQDAHAVALTLAAVSGKYRDLPLTRLSR